MQSKLLPFGKVRDLPTTLRYQVDSAGIRLEVRRLPPLWMLVLIVLAMFASVGLMALSAKVTNRSFEFAIPGVMAGIMGVALAIAWTVQFRRKRPRCVLEFERSTGICRAHGEGGPVKPFNPNECTCTIVHGWWFHDAPHPFFAHVKHFRLVIQQLQLHHRSTGATVVLVGQYGYGAGVGDAVERFAREVGLELAHSRLPMDQAVPKSELERVANAQDGQSRR